jgi:hypothetical protein
MGALFTTNPAASGWSTRIPIFCKGLLLKPMLSIPQRHSDSGCGCCCFCVFWCLFFWNSEMCRAEQFLCFAAGYRIFADGKTPVAARSQLVVAHMFLFRTWPVASLVSFFK